ncbi:MAG: hypothetical protein NTZ16_16435, partial [Verrucomicrobia bacterium]|nr:hypothetical protein [Verrucomicrobiota bacterium]
LAISQKNTEYSDISGGVAGGLAGAAAGAAIGSVVPVVGTVIGGLAGGLIGGFAGSGIGRAIGSALFNKSLDEFGQLRYLQYGFKVEDQRYTQAIYDLEKMMTRAVIRTGGQITLDPGKINAQAMAELFGADISDEKSINRWSQWMLMRFKPVYLAHANAAEKAKAGTSVLDVGSLSDDLKADFLAALKVPENIYNVTSSPVKEVPELLATQSMATQFLDTLKVKYKKDPNKAKAAK